MKTKELIKYSRVSATISIIALLIATLDLPYGYYTLLKWVVMISATLLAYTAYKLDRKLWVSLMVITGVLFNPISPIAFDKEAWAVIDLIVAGLFLLSIFKIKEQ